MSFLPGDPPFFIAEAGVNHDGDIEKALRLVDAAADAAADAVKFQTFRADSLAAADAPKAAYQKERDGEVTSQREMLRRLELSEDGFARIAARCAERGIRFLSTPFDAESADLLVRLGVGMLKLPSGELTNHPLLAHAARTGRPLLVSTGMSDLAEVDAAVAAVRAAGCRDLALLHCVSQYPAPAAAANLKAMGTMRARYGVPVGYSDHTEGTAVAVAAAALGAEVLEKHFTLDRGAPGPDHAMSLEPRELKDLVRAVRAARAALGDGEKRPQPCELELRTVARRGLVYARPLKAGAVLAEADLAAKRPAVGLQPSELPHVVGRRLREDRPADAPVRPEDIV